MDIQMPEMDGLSATQHIREQEKIDGRHMPIIAMTAHAMKGDRERFLAAGMDGYVAKPVRDQELWAAIDAIVHHAGPDAPEPTPQAPSAPAPSSRSEAALDHAAVLAR